MLAVAGIIVGASLALLPVRAVVLQAPPSIPRIAEVAIDEHVLAFAAAAAIVTTLVFGLLPALSAAG